MFFMKWGNRQEKAVVQNAWGKYLFDICGFYKKVFSVVFCTWFDSENSYSTKIFNVFKTTYFIGPCQLLSEYCGFFLTPLVTHIARIQDTQEFQGKKILLINEGIYRRVIRVTIFFLVTFAGGTNLL